MEVETKNITSAICIKRLPHFAKDFTLVTAFDDLLRLSDDDGVVEVVVVVVVAAVMIIHAE
jgi:hypothetical protein